VLHCKYSIETVAARVGKSPEEVKKLLESSRGRLLAAREMRPTPFIDTTIYTNWNALTVSAYLQAAQVLRIPKAKEFALLTLDRLLHEGLDPERGLCHVISYDGGAENKWVAGMLDDYALLTHACVEAWIGTGARKYYDAAMTLAERMIEEFYDAGGGGFWDTSQKGGEALGALTAARKPLQDSAAPAGNPAAAAALLRLEALNGRADFREIAARTLEVFATVVPHFGLYVGSYGLALQRLLADAVQVVVVGEDAAADDLEAAALFGFLANKSVIRISRLQGGSWLPPLLAETIPFLPNIGSGESFAVVCRGNACLPPVNEPEALLTSLQS
jgi:uncharacterized protein